METHQSAEDYLEMILILSKSQDKVRSIDISRALNFSRPSVSIAMKNLKEKKLITISDSNAIKLTLEGKKIAEKILKRHRIIANALIELGVSRETAEKDACKIEHDISPESFSAICDHINSREKKD